MLTQSAQTIEDKSMNTYAQSLKSVPNALIVEPRRLRDSAFLMNYGYLCRCDSLSKRRDEAAAIRIAIPFGDVWGDRAHASARIAARP